MAIMIIMMTMMMMVIMIMVMMIVMLIMLTVIVNSDTNTISESENQKFKNFFIAIFFLQQKHNNNLN